MLLKILWLFSKRVKTFAAFFNDLFIVGWTSSYVMSFQKSDPVSLHIKSRKKDYKSKRKHKAEPASKVWKIEAETTTMICRSYCTRSIRRAHYFCFTFSKWGWKLRNPWRLTCFIANVERQWLTRKTCDNFVGQS